MVQSELTSWARKKGIDLDQAGLKIYTTIDSRMQAFAEQAVRVAHGGVAERIREGLGRKKSLGG